MVQKLLDGSKTVRWFKSSKMPEKVRIRFFTILYDRKIVYIGKPGFPGEK
jgi:hypothetical protein